MNCPHCNNPLPADNPASYCPSCGRGLPAANPETAPGPKPSWLWFWAALLAPPVLTALAAFLARQSMAQASNEGMSVAVGLLGGGAGGLACGIILGLRLGKTSGARVGLALLLAAIMVPVCIITCFFGCSLAGYQMDLK
jgi:hypothetical protein